MPYAYQDFKQKLHNDKGIELIIQVRDRAKKLIKEAGAATLGEIVRPIGGDSWTVMAAVDWLVENDGLREVHAGQCAAQHRIFIWPE